MSIIEKIYRLHQQLHELNSSKNALTSTQILDVFLKQFPKEGIVDASKYCELLQSKCEVYCHENESGVLSENIQRPVTQLLAILDKVDNLAKQESAFKELSKRDKEITSLTKEQLRIKKTIKQIPEVDASELLKEYARLAELYDVLERQERGKQINEFPAPIYKDQSQQQKLVLDNLKRLLINKIGPHQWSLTKIELIELEKNKQQTLSHLKECGIQLEATPRVENLRVLSSEAGHKKEIATTLLTQLKDISNQLSGYSAFKPLPDILHKLTAKLKQSEQLLVENNSEIATFKIKYKDRNKEWLEIASTVSSSLEPLKILKQKKAVLESQKSTSLQQRAYSWINLSAWTESEKFYQEAAQNDTLINQELEYITLLEKQQKLLREQQELPRNIEKINKDIETYSQLKFENNPEKLFQNAAKIIHACGNFLTIDIPNIEPKQDNSHCFTYIEVVKQLTESITHALDKNNATQQSLQTLNALLVKSRKILSDNNIGQESFFAIVNSSQVESNLPNKKEIQEELELLIKNEQALNAYQEKRVEVDKNIELKQQLSQDLKKTAKTLSRKKASLEKKRQQLEFPSTPACEKAIQQSQLELVTLISQLEEVQLPEKEKEQQPLPAPDMKKPLLNEVLEKEPRKKEDNQQIIIDEHEKTGSPLVEEMPEINRKNKELLILLEEYIVESPDIEKELKQWYQALSKVAKQWLQQCDFNKRQNLSQAYQLLNVFIDLQQDINFAQEDEAFTTVLQSYKKLCPLLLNGDNNFTTLTPLLRLKPPFLIKDIIAQPKISIIEDMGKEELKTFNKTIEELRHEGVELDHRGFKKEYQLVENAYRIINHVGTEAQNGRDYSQALEGMREDPHYQPLEKHRGAWGKFCESIAKLITSIRSYFSGEAPQPNSYQNSVVFFKTSSQEALDNALSSPLSVKKKVDSLPKEEPPKRQDSNSTIENSTPKKEGKAEITYAL